MRVCYISNTCDASGGLDKIAVSSASDREVERLVYRGADDARLAQMVDDLVSQRVCSEPTTYRDAVPAPPALRTGCRCR